MGKIETAVDLAYEGVADLAPACLDGDHAVALLDRVIEGKKLFGAAETLLVSRVDECRIWARDGHRNMAEWLAARGGTSVGHARGVVETAQRLEDGSATDAALRDARISTEQARVITSAARVDPSAESGLLAAAEVDGMPGLASKCRQVEAAAMTEDDRVAREERIHRVRFHRRWIDDEGAACGRYRTTPASAALLWAELDAERDRIFKDVDEREPYEAYEVDALCALADRDARSHRGKRVTAILHADVQPLLTGDTEPGDTCEIAGIGPVSLTSARELLGDALLEVVLSDGVDVRTVVHPSRTVASTIRTALLWQHRECSVAGCHEVHGLEAHHTKDFAMTGRTCLDELALVCKRHHRLITTGGFGLEPRPDGQYDLIPVHHAVDERCDPQRGPPIAA
ncbi:MAG: DUF222 domain-containing protein [Acidimicrobiia bacterium]